MYSDFKKKRRFLLPCIILIAVLLIALIVIRDPGKDIGEESATAIQQAVERSSLQCYVVEGVYPPNLQYLEDNYGLQVNKNDFYITYDAFASNIPPSVVVTVRQP